MAGKKPAKPIAGKNTQHKLDAALYGTEVRYMGSKSSAATCPSCRRSIVRGMMRLKGSDFYCSVRCVSMTIPKEEPSESQ